MKAKAVKIIIMAIFCLVLLSGCNETTECGEGFAKVEVSTGTSFCYPEEYGQVNSMNPETDPYVKEGGSPQESRMEGKSNTYSFEKSNLGVTFESNDFCIYRLSHQLFDGETCTNRKAYEFLYSCTDLQETGTMLCELWYFKDSYTYVFFKAMELQESEYSLAYFEEMIDGKVYTSKNKPGLAKAISISKTDSRIQKRLKNFSQTWQSLSNAKPITYA